MGGRKKGWRRGWEREVLVLRNVIGTRLKLGRDGTEDNVLMWCAG